MLPSFKPGCSRSRTCVPHIADGGRKQTLTVTASNMTLDAKLKLRIRVAGEAADTHPLLPLTTAGTESDHLSRPSITHRQWLWRARVLHLPVAPCDQRHKPRRLPNNARAACARPATPPVPLHPRHSPDHHPDHGIALLFLPFDVPSAVRISKPPVHDQDERPRS